MLLSEVCSMKSNEFSSGVIMIFDANTLKNLTKSYQSFLKELRDDSLEQDDTSYLSEDFVLDFKKLIIRGELDKYSAHNFYWLNLIDELVDTIDLTESLEEGQVDIDDAINYLEKTEFLKMFLDNQDKDPIQTLGEIIQLKEFQIVSFFNLHINKTKVWSPTGPVAYQPVYELGENEKNLVLSNDFATFSVPPDLYQGFLPIISYEAKNCVLSLDYEDEVIECQGMKGSHLKVQYDEQLITVLTHLDGFNQDMTEKVTSAFNIIKEKAPDLYKFVFTYTNTIVPINEPGIVSYSMDTLPGYSCINLYERDLLDLVDDLVHETGHHYLNTILEDEDNLIIEDDEKIFYSPWRKAERPIRGLYHGVCTFYWAFILFDMLSQNTEGFNENQIEKIKKRREEECKMLLESRSEIDKGLELKKITPIGYKLVCDMLDHVKSIN
jgi:hypothetical protein